MNAVVQPVETISVAEYLELEACSPVKHEYVHGVIRAFAGGSDRHSEITINVSAAFHAAARGGPCRVYSSDMRIAVSQDVYYYPDVSVICDQTGQSRTSKVNPAVLVEILSQSTIFIDRREKLANYMRIDSLRDYVMIDQNVPLVEHYYRDSDGDWRNVIVVQGGTLHIACLNLDLPMATIYEDLSPPIRPGSAERPAE
jgi:Uma2 family endonuclease